MEEITFTALGRTVEYHINDTGTHETLTFDGVTIEDSSGDLGVYQSRAWKDTWLLSGAAKKAAEHKVLQDHAENLLALALRSIPELYKELTTTD